ncbi:MAG: beta-lactamase family protein [Kaiparowitsia implicata GSE-PSE-MK54-09C]|jgi:CubicO group peptidase (beta-lactamase class C family)|nr:beta-lactamase family protein [Kaiparowitsia implicata GSE-PSE-MK54-09C]
MRRLLVFTIAFMLAGVFGLHAFAPYLTTLVLEGSPTLIWRGAGHYAVVPGAPRPSWPQNSPIAELEPDLNSRFIESGGVALLAARDGKLVLERYGTGTNPETRLNSFSIAKSLVGALIFKALSEGKIESLDQSLRELLPTAPGLSDMTLRKILTMRSAVHFDSRTTSFGAPGSYKDSDTLPNPFGPLARLHFQGLDAVVHGLTLEPTPPDTFNYQNINTALLGAVLERAYGKPLETLLSEKIWLPAGAEGAIWRKPPVESSVSAYCCIYATARDWLRIGVFFAANGTMAKPFLPHTLWREFLGLDVPLAMRLDDHYGYHTLQNVLDRDGENLQGPFTYFIGQNGQILYIMPEKHLVVYRAGQRYQLLHSTLYGAWNSISRE